MKNLNKENFWNELYEKYPEAVQHFCDWIDEYKKEVEWKKLFSDHYKQGNIKRASNGEICSIDYSEPKFHDLPIEMQTGIIARYELELFNNKDGKGKEQYEIIMQAHRTQVIGLFSDLHSQIQKRKKTLN